MNSEYRELLMDIADEVTLKDFARMKFLCTDILPDVKPKDNSGELLVEVFNFFLELEKQKILSVDYLDKLKYLLDKAKRKDLVAKVEDFQCRNRPNIDESSIASSGLSSSSIRPEVSEEASEEISQMSGIIDNTQQQEDVKCVEAPSTECEEDRAKDKKRKKKAKYKQKKKAEKQLSASQRTPSNVHPQEGDDGVFQSESTVCNKSQEDEMLIETNNNVPTPSPPSSDSYSSLMITKDINEGIPSDLKPENVVGIVPARKYEAIRKDSTGQVKKEETLLPTPDKEITQEEKTTENEANVTEKEQVVDGLPKQEMPRDGQAKAAKEMALKEDPKPTNEGVKNVAKDQEKAEKSVQESHQTPVQEKDVPKDGLKQSKKKKRLKDILTPVNNVDKGRELVADVREKEKTLPKPKKDGRSEDVVTSPAKEVREELASSDEQSKEISGASTFQRRHILSLCSRWQDWGESIPVINRELCLALARAGHRVTCLVLTSSDFDKEDARKGNVELIQCSDKPGIKKDDSQLFMYHSQQINFLPDLVIGHGKVTGPASVFHAEKASCPRLHVIHDLPTECLKFDSATEQQCDEDQLARNADFVAVIGSLLKEKWSTLINRNVIELIPGLPELSTRNRIPSPQCRCFVPAKFSAPFASGLRLAVKTVNNSSKRESPPRKTTLIACNTDSSGSGKPAKKVLKEVDQRLVDLSERSSSNSQEAHFDIQGATVFLLPARVEAFGVTALDAIAVGIPVVISAHSGLAYTIRQHFDEKFHSCIKDIFLDRDGANTEGEEDDDADIWSISIDKISMCRDEAFDLASDLRSEWKKKFTWDAAVQELMHTITKSGKLPLRSPRPLPNSSLTAREVPEACLNLVKGLNIFDRRQKFVLFLSPEDPEFLQNAVHLGLVQWAAVFDFDLESTTKGYLKSCESFLENTGKPACRMLPPPKEDVGKENQSFTLPNGIPWILLQGVPDMERDVDRNLDWIQEIFHHLRKRHSTNITLLIIWNSANNNKNLCKKLYQIQLQVQASPYWKNAVQLVLLSTSNEVDSRLDDIAEEWGVKIKKVNMNQFCNALYSIATANPLYQLDPDFSLPARRSSTNTQSEVAPATLPSSIRWVDSVLEVLYTSIGKTPEFGKDDAHYFYRGGKISWYGIEMDYAVERESWVPLRKVIEEEMKYRGAAFLTLFHQRGTGGTTSARKLVYDLHLHYPCVCLKTINYETFLAIKVIWVFCSLPVIILADIKEFPGAEDNDLEALYGNLSNEKVSCLILHIVHRHSVEPKREKEPNPKDVILAKSLTEKEKKKFIKVYGLQSPAKKSELGAMKGADEQLQIPFYYGLVAFGEQFKGLEPFVSSCLQGLNERQRRALCFLSMAHQYAQLELQLSTFAGVFNLKSRQLHSIEDVLTPDSIELLIEEYGCWRPRHCTIGKEILRQLLTVPYDIHLDNWQRNLADKAIEFIGYMKEETTKAVLLNRISDEKTYKRFSSLVEDIPEDEDAVKVFKKAIVVHPNNPFFKAHLGRYYSVRRGHEGFDLALKSTDEGILLASGMSRNVRSQLMQMKGMIFKRQVKNQIEKNADLADIVSLAKEGVTAFTRSASISPDRLENCYIPQVRMMCDIFKYVDKEFKGGIFKYFHSNDADPFILDGISESSDILESVSESIYYPDLRRDLFRLGGFGRRNKPADKADLIQHFKELKKTSRTSTASINRQIVLLQLELCKETNKPISEVAEELNSLLEEALKYDKKIDLTMRLWVRVAPHIPVDLQAAESKIAAWCNQGKSALSYLYRYVFTCIRILEGGRDQRFEEDRKVARDELHKSVHSTKRLTLLHPDRPVVFLGTAKGMGQLVSVEERSESVTNVRKQRLIPESFERRLRRFTGIITKTGKVSQIKADGLTVSFRADLCQPPLIGESYQAKKVSFYLAFTYFEADAYNVKIMAE